MNTPGALSTFSLIMNRASWDAPGDAHKAVIEAETGRELSLEAARAFKAAGDRGIATLKEADVELITLDDAALEEFHGAMQEPLEAFPLESIQMMGSITQHKETFGLVKAGPNLYRVKKGNYMGQNFGVVTGIDESQISLKELIQDGAGEWIERNSALQLLETKR
jgi:Tfp pilus assembly protein PilP